VDVAGTYAQHGDRRRRLLVTFDGDVHYGAGVVGGQQMVEPPVQDWTGQLTNPNS
jgi:formylmethanofuran dehydrogenase subunit C